MPNEKANFCRWTTQADALEAFAGFTGKIESASHIKPLHWYVAGRLVVEGGFDPDDITPRPPFRVERKSGQAPRLHLDEKLARGGERTILGGLKTKNVDVVVTREGIGPVLAVSCKGVTGAFRNLTNRMEETIGECTNLHITYPALVIGYLVLLRANRRMDELLESTSSTEGDPGRQLAANDVAIAEGGEPIAAIMRFHNALRELVGRRGIRNDVSRYEAIGLGMVEMEAGSRGALLANYPEEESPLRLERFFETLFLRYDERFVTSAPDLASKTRRLAWASDSPALSSLDVDYEARIAVS
jgi:hypothetical protein